MNAKRTLVSFLAIATLLFLAATVSAYPFTAVTSPGIVAGDAIVIINDLWIGPTAPADTISLVSGETITVKVTFTADVDANNVRIKAQLEGEKVDVDVITPSFDVKLGSRYIKTFTITVPSDLDEEVSGDMALSLKIWNGDYKSETTDDIILNVQRPSYDVAVRSVLVSSSVEAGQTTPVDVVLENTGYNDLDNLYVTVRIPELSVEKTSFFGDLMVDEESHHHDHDSDATSGRIYLEIPYSVSSGVYTLEVEVYNKDFSDVVKKQVAVTNGFSEVVMKSGNDLLVLNPTNNLKVYKVVYPSADLTVAVQAGSSKLVTVETPEGEYAFDVFVFDGEKLVGTVSYSGVSESEDLASPVVILTVILAVIFVVLLVVMIVLMTKKPEKAEEFGESYY